MKMDYIQEIKLDKKTWIFLHVLFLLTKKQTKLYVWKILIYDNNPFYTKMSSRFQITADPWYRVAQIMQLSIIMPCIVRSSHDSILGSVTCWIRKIWNRGLISILKIPRIAKTSSNDDTVPQSVVAWKIHTEKRGEESEEGQKHWEILGQKKLLGKKCKIQMFKTLVGWTSR